MNILTDVGNSEVLSLEVPHCIRVRIREGFIIHSEVVQ
jgi:hypothetical protein